MMRAIVIGIGCYLWFAVGYQSARPRPAAETRNSIVARHIVLATFMALALALTIVSFRP